MFKNKQQIKYKKGKETNQKLPNTDFKKKMENIESIMS